MRTPRIAVAACLSALVVLTGCELLTNYLEGADGVASQAPQVQMPDARARLVKYPGAQMLGS